MALGYQQELTLSTLAARTAVHDLSVRQRRAFESGDLPTWIGTFVVAGVLELPGAEPVRGHGPLQNWFESVPKTQQLAGFDEVAEIEGLRGTHQSRIWVWGSTGVDGGTPFRLLATDDEVVHERGRWYFARRRIIQL